MNYADVDRDLRDFLMSFNPAGEAKEYKYSRALNAINSRQSRLLIIELDDLICHLKNKVNTSL
jgi:hypothetical protein